MTLMGCIYLIENKVNGKRYVGQTYKTLNERWAEHIKATFCKKRLGMLIHRAIKKYGVNSFDLSVIEECAEELLSEREIFWIAEKKTFVDDHPDKGYNLTRGGEGGKKSDIVKKRISESIKKTFAENPEIRERCSNSMRGKKHKPETIVKMSASRMGDKNPMKGRFGADHPTFGKTIPPMPIVQFDTLGNVIAQFISMNSAAHQIGCAPSTIWKAVHTGKLYSCSFWKKQLECHGL